MKQTFSWHEMTFNLKKSNCKTRGCLPRKAWLKVVISVLISAQQSGFIETPFNRTRSTHTFWTRSKIDPSAARWTETALYEVGRVMTEACLYHGRPNLWVIQKPRWNNHPNYVVVQTFAFFDRGAEDQKMSFLPSDCWWWVSSPKLHFGPFWRKEEEESRIWNRSK